MVNRIALYLCYVTVLLLRASFATAYIHHSFPTQVPRNLTSIWIAIVFFLVGDTFSVVLSAVNSWIDERSEQRKAARAYEADFQRRTDEIEAGKLRTHSRAFHRL